MSLVAENGEWKTRKINLFQVLRSFVSQLKPGQDLTKISLPAEICYPYTMLEVIAYRELAPVCVLNDIDKQTEPLQRFLVVLKFLLSTIREETFEKKPYNSVLGETHIAWVEDEQGNRTEFIGEQVSHHPPISAFIVRNNKYKFEITGNISFGVRFGGNSVSVTTSGAVFVTHNNETYEMTKCLPDMVIRNVVFGKKYIMWEGDITVSCPSSGYTALISFREERNRENALKGIVSHVDANEPVMTLFGRCGSKIYIETLDKKEPQLFFDIETVAFSNLQYLPFDQLEPLSSVKVWAKVNKHIVENDIPSADREKKIVEQEQRKRIQERKEQNLLNEGKYFKLNEDGTWFFKRDQTESLSQLFALAQKATSDDSKVEGSSEMTNSKPADVKIASNTSANGLNDSVINSNSAVNVNSTSSSKSNTLATSNVSPNSNNKNFGANVSNNNSTTDTNANSNPNTNNGVNLSPNIGASTNSTPPLDPSPISNPNFVSNPNTNSNSNTSNNAASSTTTAVNTNNNANSTNSTKSTNSTSSTNSNTVSGSTTTGLTASTSGSDQSIRRKVSSSPPTKQSTSMPAATMSNVTSTCNAGAVTSDPPAVVNSPLLPSSSATTSSFSSDSLNSSPQLLLKSLNVAADGTSSSTSQTLSQTTAVALSSSQAPILSSSLRSEPFAMKLAEDSLSNIDSSAYDGSKKPEWHKGSHKKRLSKNDPIKIGKKQIKEQQKEIIQKVKDTEKKRKAEGIEDHADTILAGWMKMRNSLKKWSFRWFVLKPGKLIYFKDPADVARAHCNGIISLQGCEVSIRPSKKDGACFKIWHLLQYNIYSKQGLKGETLKSAFIPVGADYMILRVNTEADRAKWMKALQSAIPDYERNKALMSQIYRREPEPDSDSESEEEDDDHKGVNTAPQMMNTSVWSSNLTTQPPFSVSASPASDKPPQLTSTVSTTVSQSNPISGISPSGSYSNSQGNQSAAAAGVTATPTGNASSTTIPQISITSPNGGDGRVTSQTSNIETRSLSSFNISGVDDDIQLEISATLTYLYKLYKRLRADQKNVLKNQEQNLKKLEDRIIQLEKVVTNQIKQIQQKDNMLAMQKKLEKHLHPDSSHNRILGMFEKYLPNQQTIKMQLLIVIFLFLFFLYYTRSIYSQLGRLQNESCQR